MESAAGRARRGWAWSPAACRTAWARCSPASRASTMAPWRWSRPGSRASPTTSSSNAATAACCSRPKPPPRPSGSCGKAGSCRSDACVAIAFRGASAAPTRVESAPFHRSRLFSMGRGPSIEARKNAEDARRGKIFTKIIREISVAARAGGGDPAANPRLRSAIDKGLSANMTKDVIERAIKKATGELEGVDYEEVRYEGYAPGGVAVIVDCLTDNRVRTVADVRHAFGKFGGNMGTEGSVAFMFHKLGVLSFAAGVD